MELSHDCLLSPQNPSFPSQLHHKCTRNPIKSTGLAAQYNKDPDNGDFKRGLYISTSNIIYLHKTLSNNASIIADILLDLKL